MEGLSTLKVCFTSSGSSSSTHTIYCKVHSLKKNSERTPNGRTLFTLGWPPYVDSDCLEDLFSRAGHVQNIFLVSKGGPVDEDDQSEGFKVGYIVMSSKSEVTSALKLCTSDVPIPCTTCDTGLGRWCQEYAQSRPSLDALETSVAAAIEQYDLRVEADKKEKEKASQPDKDGWITVTRKSSKRKLAIGEGESKKKKKKKELVNFYSWQLRETQREEIARLREKFEEDKQRVANMRAKRKFRPY